jgi:hypothetical protein
VLASLWDEPENKSVPLSQPLKANESFSLLEDGFLSDTQNNGCLFSIPKVH